jgi:predicted component of type VI protein secretion system
MGSQVDVMSATREWRVSLESDRATIGKAGENDVALPDDPTASHLHAVLERFPAGWCVADLGSSNGTWLNGTRIWSSQRLRHGDEIRVGQTRIIFRDPHAAAGQTESEDAAPALTARERDVLVALCRPLLTRDLFTEPASTRAIADELVITQAAVKQHLGNLYDKFGVPADDSSRRVRLANDALRRGAVSISDLRADGA